MDNFNVEFAVVCVLENGEEMVIFGPFGSSDYAREALADMKTWDTYKDKKLYVARRLISPWKPY